MGGRACSLLLTLAAVTLSYLDCDADHHHAAAATHLRHDDVTASRTSCQRQLSDDIETCLFGYEQLLVASRALGAEPGQLQRPVARRLCSEYYETLQCLYDSLLKCPADQSHLYVIASRLGHLRTFMQQTCAVTATPRGVDRHTPDVTSRETRHVTTLTPTSVKSRTVTVTRQTDKFIWSETDVGGRSSSSVTKPAPPSPPKSLSLHSCAVSPTTRFTAFISLMPAVISAILRRRLCPT